MKPSVGRIVHYWPAKGDGLDTNFMYAAMVTGLRNGSSDDCVNLHVYGRSATEKDVKIDNVRGAVDAISQDRYPGHWHWPPRV